MLKRDNKAVTAQHAYAAVLGQRGFNQGQSHPPDVAVQPPSYEDSHGDPSSAPPMPQVTMPQKVPMTMELVKEYAQMQPTIPDNFFEGKKVRTNKKRYFVTRKRTPSDA